MWREDAPGREARYLRVLRVAAHHHGGGHAAEASGVAPGGGCAAARAGAAGFFANDGVNSAAFALSEKGFAEALSVDLGLGPRLPRRRRRRRRPSRKSSAPSSREPRTLAFKVRERAHALGHRTIAGLLGAAGPGGSGGPGGGADPNGRRRVASPWHGGGDARRRARCAPPPPRRCPPPLVDGGRVHRVERCPRGFVGKHGAALPGGVHLRAAPARRHDGKGGAGRARPRGGGGAGGGLLVVIHRHALAAFLLHVHVGGDAALDLARDARRLRLGDAPRALVDGGGVHRLVERSVHAEHGLVRGELVPARRRRRRRPIRRAAALGLPAGSSSRPAPSSMPPSASLARRGRPRDEPRSRCSPRVMPPSMNPSALERLGPTARSVHAHVAAQRDQVGERVAHGGRGAEANARAPRVP